MEQNLEIRRLLDTMPASGRMMTKIFSKPQQAKVIDASFPLPWNSQRPIYINFDLWSRLNTGQRDLLLLHTVCWLTGVKWYKADIYQGIAVAGLLAELVELAQKDPVGIIAAGGLTAFALVRIWRNNRSQESEINADDAAIRVALRRGYSETEAAQNLLSAIETVAKIEGRSTLNFTELIRSQNLRIRA